MPGVDVPVTKRMNKERLNKRYRLLLGWVDVESWRRFMFEHAHILALLVWRNGLLGIAAQVLDETIEKKNIEQNSEYTHTHSAAHTHTHTSTLIVIDNKGNDNVSTLQLTVIKLRYKLLVYSEWVMCVCVCVCVCSTRQTFIWPTTSGRLPLIWRHSTVALIPSLHCCQLFHLHLHHEFNSPPSHHCILLPATVTVPSLLDSSMPALTSTARSVTDHFVMTIVVVDVQNFFILEEKCTYFNIFYFRIELTKQLWFWPL